MKIHLLVYSNNEPFETTKRLTVDSLPRYTNKEFLIHEYDLDKIKQLKWFSKIQGLPTINRAGKRDGYYNSWKAFLTKEVYDKMGREDILYYVDSSQYFRNGFTQNIDKLCDIAFLKGCIAGSVGNNVLNNSYSCCDNLSVWNAMIPNHDNSVHLSKMHVLNSWFIMTKNDLNTQFVNDWTHYCLYTDETLLCPLITYHHTADQSIFNILVTKYELPVFYSQNVIHDENKNKNRVLEIINASESCDPFIISL